MMEMRVFLSKFVPINQAFMKNNTLKFGIIAGFISSIWFMLAMLTGIHDKVDMTIGMVIGFSTMIAAFALIFVAVKKQRDQSSTGGINFGPAFLTGLYISLIASTFYVLIWLLSSYTVFSDFTEKYTKMEIDNLKKAGASEQAIAAKTKEMAEFSENYKNPVVRAAYTYMEILPVGILVSLIAAAILKRKPRQEASV
jgi:hypothetical protein